MIKFLATLALCASASVATAENKHAEYYYPTIGSEEVFDRVVRRADGVSRGVRVDFINVLTAAQLDAPESPRFVFFGKGSSADNLILVALDDEVFGSIYRARALLAQLTVSVRKGGFFRAQELQSVVTFYDMLQLLEFDDLVISDGKSWSHRVDFVRE